MSFRKKMDSFWLQLSVCFICCSNGESFNHLFSDCNSSLAGLVCSEFSICIGFFPFNFQGQCSSAMSVLQEKMDFSCFQPSVCLLVCSFLFVFFLAQMGNRLIIYFDCHFSLACWFSLFRIFLIDKNNKSIIQKGPKAAA